jgi:hypothetical protein
VRIAGVLVPPGYLRWAAAGAGVVLLGTLIATAVGIAGLFGASVEDQGRTVEARVVAGSPCDKPGATEKVRFTMDEKDHEVRFDGCGHAEEEEVAVTVPDGPLTGDLVVHAAEAAVGDSKDGEGLGLLLIVVSGMAGAGYAFLVRRGPRTTRLPKTLRLV